MTSGGWAEEKSSGRVDGEDRGGVAGGGGRGVMGDGCSGSDRKWEADGKERDEGEGIDIPRRTVPSHLKGSL